jgi:hypothetical protein
MARFLRFLAETTVCRGLHPALVAIASQLTRAWLNNSNSVQLAVAPAGRPLAARNLCRRLGWSRKVNALKTRKNLGQLREEVYYRADQ